MTRHRGKIVFVTVVGVTGHQRIPPEAHEWVASKIRAILRSLELPLTGYSSLAMGADQLFANEIVDAGGDLVAVIPCQDYETTFAADDLTRYRAALTRARQVIILDYPTPSREAFRAAGIKVADNSDVMVAVWDGEDSRGMGDTTDAVSYAKQIGKPIVVVWPSGVSHQSPRSPLSVPSVDQPQPSYLEPS